MGAKILRPKKDGTSNLGGVIKVLVYTLDQFEADTEWPKRADIISAGKSTVVPPLLDSDPEETAARLIFDLETGAKVKATSSGPATNQVFVHALEGARIAGYNIEQNLGLDSVYNQHVVLVAVMADGVRVVLGSTYKPMTINSDFDGGAKSADMKGTALTTSMENGVDFRPVILDSTVTLAETTVPAYS